MFDIWIMLVLLGIAIDEEHFCNVDKYTPRNCNTRPETY